MKQFVQYKHYLLRVSPSKLYGTKWPFNQPTPRQYFRTKLFQIMKFLKEIFAYLCHHSFTSFSCCRPKPDNQIVFHTFFINTCKLIDFLFPLTKQKFSRILGSKQYYSIFQFFAFLVFWSKIHSSGFVFIWSYQSAGPARIQLCYSKAQHRHVQLLSNNFFCHKPIIFFV